MQSKGNVLLSLIFFTFFFLYLRRRSFRLLSPKSQLLLQVCFVPHSEVNDLDPLLFLPHIRPSLTHYWVLQRLTSCSLKTQGSLRPRSSQGKKTSIIVANVSFCKLLLPQLRHCCLDFKTVADTTSYQFPSMDILSQLVSFRPLSGQKISEAETVGVEERG